MQNTNQPKVQKNTNTHLYESALRERTAQQTNMQSTNQQKTLTCMRVRISLPCSPSPALQTTPSVFVIHETAVNLHLLILLNIQKVLHRMQPCKHPQVLRFMHQDLQSTHNVVAHLL